MDNTRHQGKVMIVTGAGNGIGRATVLRLAAEGARVIGCDMVLTALEETARLAAERNLKVDLLQADITSQNDVNKVIAAAGDHIDALCNVAGIMDWFLPAGEVDDETWARVLDVNVTGVMRLSRAVLPIMEKQGGGSIVTVASKASVGAGAAGAAYTTSKHAVIGLVKSIAYFYGPKKIRSNAVLPGAVATDIGTTAMPKSEWAMGRAQLSMATMNPQPADPDQIASAISWLASDEASNINGATLLDDGGWASA